MQVGSLIECIDDDWYYNPGGIKPLNLTGFPKKGEIGVCDALQQDLHDKQFYLKSFSWTLNYWWNAKAFREIQPPMKINIEEFIKEPELC